MKKAKKKKPFRMPRSGACFNCRATVDGNFYCFGCKTHVCYDCYEPEALMLVNRPHKPDAHLIRIVRVPRGWKNETKLQVLRD